jgi:hypothetical protein
MTTTVAQPVVARVISRFRQARGLGVQGLGVRHHRRAAAGDPGSADQIREH